MCARGNPPHRSVPACSLPPPSSSSRPTRVATAGALELRWWPWLRSRRSVRLLLSACLPCSLHAAAACSHRRLLQQAAVLTAAARAGLIAPFFFKRAVDVMAGGAIGGGVAACIGAIAAYGACKIVSALAKELQIPLFAPLGQARLLPSHTRPPPAALTRLLTMCVLCSHLGGALRTTRSRTCCTWTTSSTLIGRQGYCRACLSVAHAPCSRSSVALCSPSRRLWSRWRSCAPR